jgi:hemerythrin-like domain-containing protein
VQRDDVGGREEFVLGHRPHSELGRMLGLQVLAPGNDVHAEGETDLGHLAAELAQADNSQARTRELEAESALPAPFANVTVLCADVARQREDQAPRQLRGRHPQSGSSSDLDAEFATRVEVDRGVRHPRGDEQLQGRCVAQCLAREGRAFAHGDHDLGVRKCLGQGFVGEVLGSHVELVGAAGDPGQLLPGTEHAANILIVVENQNTMRHERILAPCQTDTPDRRARHQMDANTVPDRPLIQQMVVIHRVFRREFGLLPAMIRGVAADDLERAKLVAAHVTGLLRFVHIHHSGEDELLWPVLLERVEVESDLIKRMEHQHERVAALLPHAQEQLPGWAAQPSIERREELAATFEEIGSVLGEHLGEEEVQILPLVETHLTVAEWERLGEHARGHLAPPDLMASLAAIVEEADDEERLMFTAALPPPVLTMFVEQAEPAYRERMRLLRAGV